MRRIAVARNEFRDMANITTKVANVNIHDHNSHSKIRHLLRKLSFCFLVVHVFFASLRVSNFYAKMAHIDM